MNKKQKLKKKKRWQQRRKQANNTGRKSASSNEEKLPYPIWLRGASHANYFLKNTIDALRHMINHKQDYQYASPEEVADAFEMGEAFLNIIMDAEKFDLGKEILPYVSKPATIIRDLEAIKEQRKQAAKEYPMYNELVLLHKEAVVSWPYPKLFVTWFDPINTLWSALIVEENGGWVGRLFVVNEENLVKKRSVFQPLPFYFMRARGSDSAALMRNNTIGELDVQTASICAACLTGLYIVFNLLSGAYPLAKNKVSANMIPPSKTTHGTKKSLKSRPDFSFHTIKLELFKEAKEKAEPLGGTHASPRHHWRRGHVRTLASGKQVVVRACEVGSRQVGVVEKEYRI